MDRPLEWTCSEQNFSNPCTCELGRQQLPCNCVFESEVNQSQDPLVDSLLDKAEEAPPKDLGNGSRKQDSSQHKDAPPKDPGNGSKKQGSSSSWEKWAVIGASSVLGGCGLVVAAPFALTAVGFTGAGIAANSIAAAMMSSAAIANGGTIAAGSMVAVLQSVGAAGLGAVGTAVVGGTGAVVAGGTAAAIDKLSEKDEPDNEKN